MSHPLFMKLSHRHPRPGRTQKKGRIAKTGRLDLDHERKSFDSMVKSIWSIIDHLQPLAEFFSRNIVPGVSYEVVGELDLHPVRQRTVILIG